jgi:pterin-4a-carbinolamine dehydratase
LSTPFGCILDTVRKVRERSATVLAAGAISPPATVVPIFLENGTIMQPFTFFISYRREFTAPIALLLKSEIEKRMSFVRVYVDVAEMQIGEEFPQRLEGMINGSHAVIVLAGKNWMARADAPASGQADDWVVKELEYARSAPWTAPPAEVSDATERLFLPIFANCPGGFGQFVLPPGLAYLKTMHIQHIEYANWPALIGPLLDEIAQRCHVKVRPNGDVYPKPQLSKARTQPLSDEELMRTLRYDDFEGWYIDNLGIAQAQYLVKKFEFLNFKQAIDFMALVAEHCAIVNHHPEWRNVFKHVTVSLTTWDAGRRITIYDLNLALFMNKAAKAIRK